MKTASFPSLRVDADLGEAIERRQTQAAFLARGLQSSAQARRTGVYHAAESVHRELQARLDARRKQVLG